MLLTNDLEVAVDMQAAMAIALPRHLFGERAGADADGPDHGAGLDALAVGEGHAVGIHGGHRGIEPPLDPQCRAGFDDRRADAFAQGRADLVAAIDNDHLHLSVLAQHCAQAGGHFARGLDAGEAAAGHHHGVARR
ncbi:hypothetical protein D9M71_495370 [compost metagenome]